MNVQNLAELADKIVETNSHVMHTPTVAALSPAPTNTNTQALSAELKQLQVQVAQLAAQVQTITTMTSSHMMGRGRSWSKRRDQSKGHQKDNHNSHSRAASHDRDGECWYHQRHGANAHKCVPPCSFSSTNSDTQSNQGNGPARS